MALQSWANINSWLENNVKEAQIQIKRTDEEDLQNNSYAYEVHFVWFSPNQIRKYAVTYGNSLQEALSNAKDELGD